MTNRTATPRRGTWLAAGCAAALLAVGAPAAAQNLLTNGDFEAVGTGWTIVGAQTFVNTGLGVGGSRGMVSQMIGVTNEFSQTVGTIPGASYGISYALYNNLGGTSFFQSSFAGQVLQTLNNPAQFGFTTYNFTATATGASSQLLFVIRHDPSFYVVDNVSVTLLSLPSLAVPGASQNVAAVAGGLDNAIALNMAAFVPYAALYLMTPAQRAVALDTMTGEVVTGLQSTALSAGSLFLDTMGSAARGPLGGCDGQAGRRWSSWAVGQGSGARMDGNSQVGSADLRYSTGGLAAGLGWCGPQSVLGVAVSAGWGSTACSASAPPTSSAPRRSARMMPRCAAPSPPSASI